jgi:hypothetical protein
MGPSGTIRAAGRWERPDRDTTAYIMVLPFFVSAFDYNGVIYNFFQELLLAAKRGEKSKVERFLAETPDSIHFTNNNNYVRRKRLASKC